MLEQNDAAPAPADNAAVPDDLDAALLQTWADNNEEPSADDQEVNEAPDSQEDAADVEGQTAPEPTSELPSDLPVALKDHWGAMPQEAREAIERAHRDMSHKLGDKTRELQRIETESQGISPIRDVLVEVAREHPAYSSMTPAQVAQEMRQLAQYGQAIQNDPVSALAHLAQQYGVQGHLAQIFSGQQPQDNSPALMARIAQLEGQIAQAGDPSTQQQNFEQQYAQQRTLEAVQSFANGADHWADVEKDLPLFVPVAQRTLGEGAAPEAVLEAAYNMAINQLMPDKAPKPEPAPEANPEPDPAKVEQALKAKSVNVSGRTTGKARTMTLDDELGAVFDRSQAR